AGGASHPVDEQHGVAVAAHPVGDVVPVDGDLVQRGRSHAPMVPPATARRPGQPVPAGRTAPSHPAPNRAAPDRGQTPRRPQGPQMANVTPAEAWMLTKSVSVPGPKVAPANSSPKRGVPSSFRVSRLS